MLVMRDGPTSRRFPILSGFLDSEPLLLPAMQVPNAFSLLTSAVKETVHGAGKTHVFQSLPQSLTASMKPHRYIVQRDAEACGDSLPRLAQDVGAPDNIGIVCLERRQQLIEAVAYHLVDLWVGCDCLTREFEILLFHQNLSAPVPDRAALVIGDCRRQDPAKPSPD